MAADAAIPFSSTQMKAVLSRSLSSKIGLLVPHDILQLLRDAVGPFLRLPGKDLQSEHVALVELPDLARSIEVFREADDVHRREELSGQHQLQQAARIIEARRRGPCRNEQVQNDDVEILGLELVDRRHVFVGVREMAFDAGQLGGKQLVDALIFRLRVLDHQDSELGRHCSRSFAASRRGECQSSVFRSMKTVVR
jgi:hypothetical protein